MNDFSNGLFDDQFAYNGIATQENGFLGDGTGYLLGKVRLRQIRVKKGFQFLIFFYDDTKFLHINGTFIFI